MLEHVDHEISCSNKIITLRACARGKVIGLSVCRCYHCSQKIRIFRDSQVQVSHGWYITVKLSKKLTYLYSYLLLTIHECNKL